MKRKYLSALLMGTLAMASTSTFTSCKDYDSDISSLQQQIDKLASTESLQSKVDELKNLITANSTSLTAVQEAVKKAQAAAEAAQTTADKKAALEDLKSELANYPTTEQSQAIVDAAVKSLQNGDIKALSDAIAQVSDSQSQLADDYNKIAEALQKDYYTKSEIDGFNEATQTAIAAVKKQAAEDLAKSTEETLELLKKYATKNDLDTVLTKANEAATEIVAAERVLIEAERMQDKKEVYDLQDSVAAKFDKVNALIETIKTDAAKAQSTADEAKAMAIENATKIAGLAQTTADASAALALAKQNKTAIDDAKQLIGEGFSAENTVAAALQAVKGDVAGIKTRLEGLEGRLSTVETTLTTKVDQTVFDELKTRVDGIEKNLKAIVGEYTTMVTGVSFVLTHDGANSPELNFTSGKVLADLVFGKDQKDNTGKKVADAENQQTYKKDTYFNNETSITIRVNPTNADITASDIKLVDSQGNDLSDVLELGTPKRADIVLSRAAGNNTGLWTIPVKVKDGVASNKIEQLTADGMKHKLYAVAIQNTASDSSRYVTSEYDLSVEKPTDFVAATNIDEVKIYSVNTMGYDKAITLSSTDKVVASNGEEIKIDFSAYTKEIEYFYVVRDDNNNNDPASFNAWKSYQYGGTSYGKVVKASDGGTLSVNVDGKLGDEINFRIFAVGFDGKVVPATGSSFKVLVGEEVNKVSATGTLQANDADYMETGWVAINGALKDANNGTNSILKRTGGHVTMTTVDGKVIDVHYKLSTDGKNDATETTQLSKCKYIKFWVNNTDQATEWADGSVYTKDKLSAGKGLQIWADNTEATGTLHDDFEDANTTPYVNTITVKLTKKMPTKADAQSLVKYTWKDKQKVDDTYTSYLYPVGNWTDTGVDTGKKDMTQAINGLKKNIVIEVENAKKETDRDGMDYYTGVLSVGDTESFVQKVDKELIDGETKHKSYIAYNFGPISSANEGADYKVTMEEFYTVFTCPLNETAQTFAWTKNGSKNVNELTYNNATTVDGVNLADYIVATNAYDNTEFGGKLSGLFKGVSEGSAGNGSKYILVSAKLISVNTGEEDYFLVKPMNTNGEITFETKSGTTNPTEDVPSYLVLEFDDCFGHRMTYNLPFTVKRAK